MSSQQDINFLTPGTVPGNASVVIAAGALATILTSTGFSNSLYLKRIDAVCTVAGVAGTFSLRDASGVLMTFAVGASAAGAVRTWEFPVPIQSAIEVGGAAFQLELSAGIGTWSIFANGFCM